MNMPEKPRDYEAELRAVMDALAESVAAASKVNLLPNPLARHWIGMAGLHGCMPATCGSYDAYDDACEALADIHDLGSRRRRELRRDGYLELNLHRDGNEYIEITECNCTLPENHND